MLTAEDAARCVPQYRLILDAVETQFPGASERERFHESLRQLIDTLVSGLIEGTLHEARAAGVETCDDVRSFPRRLAAFTREAAETSRELKRFLYAKVYASPELSGERNRSVERIGELFQFFLDHPEKMPHPYSEQVLDLPAYRVVCDYIAGMTDAFFRRTCEQTIGKLAIPPIARS
jgi:dGTPase